MVDVTIDELSSIADASTAASDVYNVVVVRRFLGLRYEAAGNPADAARQYKVALDTAVPAGLDTEIGHLYRLLGVVQSQAGVVVDAIAALERAVAHEAHPRCRFWRAISARELGDAVMRGIGRAIDPQAPAPELARASAAYREGRTDFDFVVPAGVIPVARGIAQQMFRSYTDNAVQVAMLANPAETLAEIEAMGRRMATDALAEARAAYHDSPAAYAAYRAARDIYGKDLFLFNFADTPDADFAVYLDNIIIHRTERQAYLTTRNRLTGPIRAAQDSLGAARELLALRIPNTVFLVFHVGQQQLFCIRVDAGSGQAATYFAPVDAAEWRAKHDEYRAAILDARVPPSPPPDPAAAMTAALDKILGFYATVLGGLLEGMLPFLKGRRLVVIPGERMNEVPLHALPVAGRPLAEHCVVGYTASIGLFLQVHADATDAEGAPLVVHDVRRTPFYAGTMNMVIAAQAEARVEKDASWQGFRAVVAELHPRDLIFACHGAYDTDDPRRSVLSFTTENSVPFATLFAELDLGGCRSIAMGACESGRGRTLLSAEYVGLPLAFLSAGARCVVGSLWQLNQIASAILLAYYLTRLHQPDATPAIALTEAQRRILHLSQDETIAWFQAYLPDRAAVFTPFIRKMGENPFAHPYYWAWLMLTGDL